ncbi:endolytic transglycosylase MltG [Priestia flexa]|uniref:endolytic transglycosylase MltG n=1 Tax=Priestia flexa TaxID=86664 RepID=UPI0032EADF93
MNSLTIRGFAIGILTATSILAVVYVIQENNAASLKISAADLRAYAKDHEYILIKEKEYKDSLKPDFEKQENIPKTNEVSISITAGMSSLDIANTLVNNHVINSTDEFEDLVAQKNASTKFQVGTYTLTSNMSLEQIVNTLTK